MDSSEKCHCNNCEPKKKGIKTSSESCEDDCLGKFIPINTKHVHKHKRVLIIGAGCAGSLIAYNLAKDFQVHILEAGKYRIDDGATYNLAIGAPAVTNQYALVAAQHPTFTEPLPATQWQGLTFLPLWNVVTPPTVPGIPAFPSVIIQSYSAGWMFGGSFEHIQGVRVNPSTSRCDRWVRILRDDDYLPENLYPLIMKTEQFRSHTDSTTQTWDKTLFAPLDGPSILGSQPINRGYEGLLQITQASPSSFSEYLAKATYNYYHDVKKYCDFTIQPEVKDYKSTTFNSGINACVTRSPERYIDKHRTRVTTARNYLNPTVIQTDSPNVPDGNPGYFINNGPFYGINGFNIRLDLNTLIQRIVFKTKNGYPDGCDYWTHNYPHTNIKAKHFCKPLRAIGVVYGPSSNNSIFVPLKEVICTLGVLGTPALLMQSGIGPRSVLEGLNIPVLKDQPNMGRNISNHYGCVIRWTGDTAKWGATEIGTENANGYLPISENPIRRKFQYFSSASPTTNPPSWAINLYDLNPKSTGWLQIKQNWTTTSNLLAFDVFPNYYAGLAGQEDINNLCEVVRDMSAAIYNRDPTATFISPTLPYPFNVSNNVLFQALITPLAPNGFVSQAHYVGSCGMGLNPETSCVDTQYKLRGTSNVYVCDASSTPLEEDKNGFVYPVQNDGNTTGSVIAFAQVFSEKFKRERNDCC